MLAQMQSNENSLTLLVRRQNGTVTWENNLIVSYEVKYILTI